MEAGSGTIVKAGSKGSLRSCSAHRSPCSGAGVVVPTSGHLVTEELQEVVSGADQAPLFPYMLESSAEELSEASRLFDLASHGLDDGLPQGIRAPALPGPQLAVHQVPQGGASGDRSSWCGRDRIAVLVAADGRCPALCVTGFGSMDPA